MTATQERATPFRAGAVPGQQPPPLVTAEDIRRWEAELAARTLLADVSEFQPSLADAAYLAWSKAIVIRCAYGDAHDDGAWYGGARRAALHKGGVEFLGIYQYLVAAQDPVAQADAFIRIVGKLQPGEVPICDLEEGAGNQSARWGAWRSRILGEYPQLRTAPLGGPMLYSGLYFEEHAGLSAQWVAAYQAAEPAVPHVLWQLTDAYPVPGVGSCDCSLYHGTSRQLAQLVTPAGQPAPTPPPPAREDEMGSVPPLSTGTGAVSEYTFPGGSQKQIGFAADPGLSAGGAGVVLRVACHSSANGWSQVDKTLTIGARGGRQVVVFAAGDVDAVSVQRVAGGAGDDAPVGVSIP